MMFSNAKVGDRVWCVKDGWGTIKTIKPEESYPLKITFDNGNYRTFMIDGKHESMDEFPILFWDSITITPPPKPKRKVIKSFKYNGYARLTATGYYTFTSSHSCCSTWKRNGHEVYEAELIVKREVEED